MSEENLSGQAGLKKLAELIQDIRLCMLTTAAPDGSFDARPMATQKFTEQRPFDGTVYFLTRSESGKVYEIAKDTHVSLLYTDPGDGKFISAKGRASIYRDQEQIDDMWNPMYKAWFPDGPEDPAIAILSVHVTEAQYWEASSSRIVRGLKYVAAAATGGQVDIGRQGTVTL